MKRPVSTSLVFCLTLFILTALVACGGGGGGGSAGPASSGSTSTASASNNDKPETLTPGTTLTMTADSSVLVPAGTTVLCPNGDVVTVASNDTTRVQAGAIVTVPSNATGAADSLISTGGTTAGSTSTPSVNVTVIAGSATTNLNPVDGTGTNAVFWGGGHIALDNSGNLVVSDRGNLRLVTLAGVVTTYGNAGLIQGFDGVAVDLNGNIFASGDNFTVVWNGYLQELTASGTVTTLLSSWESTPHNPSTGEGGLCLNRSDGNLYTADEVGNRVIKFTPAGAWSVFAGSGTSGFQDGVGGSALFNAPEDIAVDSSGNLFVADRSNNAIRKIATDGTVTTVATLKTAPTAVAVDQSGNIYTAVSVSSIVRISPDGTTTQFSTGISDSITALVSDGQGNLYAGTRGTGAQILKITF